MCLLFIMKYNDLVRNRTCRIAFTILTLFGQVGCAASEEAAAPQSRIAKSAWDIDNGAAWTGLLQRGSVGGTAGEPTDPYDDSTSEICLQLGDGSIDLDFRPLIGFQRASAIVLQANAAPYLALFGVSEIRDGATVTQLSPFWSVELRIDDTTSDQINEPQFPIATALSFAPTLATKGEAPKDTWDAVSVLRNDGVVLQFAAMNVHESVLTRDRESAYSLAGTLAAPPLKEGELRTYCDIETLWDGDVVLTFAAGPMVVAEGDDFLREGWVRFDAQSGEWDEAVTSYFGAEFLHSAKDGRFQRSSCMSVDSGSYAHGDKIVFATNLFSDASGHLQGQPHLWQFEVTDNGVFPIDWVENIPTSGGGFGEVEDVGIVDKVHYIVHHDFEIGPANNEDRVEALGMVDGHLEILAQSYLTEDYSSVTVSGPAGEVGCDPFGVLVETTLGSPISSSSNGTFQCGNLFAATVDPCSEF